MPKVAKIELPDGSSGMAWEWELPPGVLLVTPPSAPIEPAPGGEQPVATSESDVSLPGSEVTTVEVKPVSESAPSIPSHSRFVLLIPEGGLRDSYHGLMSELNASLTMTTRILAGKAPPPKGEPRPNAAPPAPPSNFQGTRPSQPTARPPARPPSPRTAPAPIVPSAERRPNGRMPPSSPSMARRPGGIVPNVKTVMRSDGTMGPADKE